MPKLSLAKLERHLYAAADILRREGMDAATYKDFIFGMLFLKRCSDVFEAAREKIVQQHVAKGMKAKEAEKRYGDNQDYYDDFYVPERARWPYLQEHLNDAQHPYGSVLDKALAALSESNESLEHVLDHIQFMKVQSNKRIVSDEACKELVRQFTRYRLRNEDFQFSDLLGSAYEFLINRFAESAGKKGGDFYTPRDVIRLMIRVLHPKPGMKIYDPTCGSGGMLIIGREYIEQSGGDPTNLRLCGQVNDASAWAICKLNMLLHGIRGADIQLQDTLLHPLHREAGELERFDRVLANPPFSQNYTRTNMEFPERFHWGWCPTTGKKADLMFAQHMLAVCKPNGMVATVMPHGVLFRGGAEKEIRKKLLEQDLIEAIIGLPENLFYGAAIPACILVMRPNFTGRFPNPNKPEGRQGQILFINADAEYLSRPAQNYLLPEHIEKIASTFERYEDVAGYARRVPLAEITNPANDCNLNIRRYVDNSPFPEPHDVRAHLAGGVPVAEIDAPAQRSFFQALGFEPTRVFVARPNDACYRDFVSTLTDRSAVRPLVEADAGVQAKEQALGDALESWWITHAPRLANLPKRRDLNAVRADFLKTFTTAMEPLGVLDRFKLAGVIATWWTDTLPDFKTLIENGFAGVIDGWVDAIADAVEDDDNVGPAFDPFAHKLVRRMMADYLQQIESAKAEIARLKGEKDAIEQSNAPDDLDEEELAEWNYAKDIEKRLRELLVEHRDAIRRSAKLDRAATKKKATNGDRKAADDAKAVLQPVFDQVAALEAELAPYDKIKEDLAAARSRFRALTSAFIAELETRCESLDDGQKQALVLELFLQDVQAGLGQVVTTRRQEMIRSIERLWEKYAQPLAAITKEREQVTAQVTDGLADWDNGRPQPIYFIDFDHPENNDFLVINQFKVELTSGRGHVIPDAVLFINGIPVVVAEFKSPGIENPLHEAINQLLRYSNQRRELFPTQYTDNEGVERLFHTNQLLIASNFFEARAATAGAPPEAYLEWSDTSPVPLSTVAQEIGVIEQTPELGEAAGELAVVGPEQTERVGTPLFFRKREQRPEALRGDEGVGLKSQQILIAGTLRPAHLLDLIRNFTVFQQVDGKTRKVVARYQQFRAIHRAVERLQEGRTKSKGADRDERGGIIWHTQGSGKSLSMVFLVRKMRTLRRLNRFKIVAVTDRTDLEVQLRETARLSGETIRPNERDVERRESPTARTQRILAEPTPDIVFAMLQKYQDVDRLAKGGEKVAMTIVRKEKKPGKDQRVVEKEVTFEENIHFEKFPVLNKSDEILVLVDEAHRSHSHDLHRNLQRGAA